MPFIDAVNRGLDLIEGDNDIDTSPVYNLRDGTE